MKKLIITGGVLALILPFAFAGAQMGAMMNWNDAKSDQVGMMQYVEDKAVGADLHDKLETLMEKMMDGTLTETEANNLADLAKQYPGQYGMMMGRLNDSGLVGYSPSDVNGGYYGMHGGMMGGWGGGHMEGLLWVGTLVWLTMLVWLIVGLLAIVLLWRKVRSNQ